MFSIKLISLDRYFFVKKLAYFTKLDFLLKSGPGYIKIDVMVVNSFKCLVKEYKEKFYHFHIEL